MAQKTFAALKSCSYVRELLNEPKSGVIHSLDAKINHSAWQMSHSEPTGHNFAPRTILSQNNDILPLSLMCSPNSRSKGSL